MGGSFFSCVGDPHVECVHTTHVSGHYEQGSGQRGCVAAAVGQQLLGDSRESPVCLGAWKVALLQGNNGRLPAAALPVCRACVHEHLYCPTAVFLCLHGHSLSVVFAQTWVPFCVRFLVSALAKSSWVAMAHPPSLYNACQQSKT